MDRERHLLILLTASSRPLFFNLFSFRRFYSPHVEDQRLAEERRGRRFQKQDWTVISPYIMICNLER